MTASKPSHSRPEAEGSGQRYLITGASGFLGRHLLQTLKQAPQVQALPLLRNAADWSAMDWTRDLPVTQLIEGGLLNREHWQEQTGELDGIFHLAALVRHSRQNAEEVYQTNIKGTLEMVELAAEKQCRLVYVSTSGTVGVFSSRHEWADEHGAPREKQVARWPYYDSKLKAERAAQALAQKLGVELVIIRPPVLLGPGDHRFRSTGHIIRLMRGKLPFLIAGGMHFIDIRDAAAALHQAMQIAQARPVYHLSGVACSIQSFFGMVERASGIQGPRRVLPQPAALSLAHASRLLCQILPGAHESPLPDPVVVEMATKFWDIRSRYAREELGFLNRNGQSTINDTVAWLIDHHPKLRHLQRASRA